MALQSSGPISFADINAEFARGAGTQLSMSQLYRNGGIVPDASVNAGIPTSGAIGLGQFYGATRRVPVNITISTNQTNYVLNTAKAAGYVAGASDVAVTINSGIYLSANATNVYALDVDTSWATGDAVTIVNNGFIVGMGGAGGKGAGSPNVALVPGTAGGSGGTAVRAQRAISVQNNGTIAGGGGGGGGGANGAVDGGKAVSGFAGAGGGGGRSSAAANSAAGLRGSGGDGTITSGSAGTVSAPGAGGTVGGGANSGVGGSGGGWGVSGVNGGNRTAWSGYATNGQLPATAGGAAGAAVAGNANITWLATGTRLGTIA